ncbi:hypothetical protein Cch01nite_07480 [Cellulomonas chitinilytica]|uniref:Uncharacterized protein n=1 Tax=Cellulomonas chitinilytica TaxID=398759 RepID=A0A919P2Q9_9CELL|nr:hypothetical protein [Cellulomonas chitinilytica]GIG20024.1 hypothetical protein Cch01nite_07480 [Cellulomonas chitinilytica]
MAGLSNEAYVLNTFIESAAGSHRVPGWSFGRAREVAMRNVWDRFVLVGDGIERYARETDSNINNACVYSIRDAAGRVSVFLSTLFPSMTVYDATEGHAISLDALELPEAKLARRMESLGIRYIGDELCRTESPYVDDEDGHRLTYFEVLFEWVDGSPVFEGAEVLKPWR